METKMEQKQTAAEDLARMVQWFKEIDVGELARRGCAVAVAMAGGAIALAFWCVAFGAFNEFVAGHGYGWIVGGVGLSGGALLASLGVLWLVWALWTDEL